MAVEQWAQRIVERELSRTVVVHDDGSQPSMYDLRIGAVNAPDLAIECVGAVDSIRTETWNLGPARGPLCLSLNGNWYITIRRQAHIRAIKRGVEPILRRLEERGLDRVYVDHVLKRHDAGLFRELHALGILRASCFLLPGTGQVYLGMEGIGGAVHSTGSALPQWIEEFLSNPQQADVLFKLDHSGATERHVFVCVAFGGAPWEVESYLTEAFDCLPMLEPKLPRPVTGVWITSTHGTKGIRWDRAGWRRFKVREESK